MTTRMRHDFDAGSDQSAATLRTVRAYHDGWVRKDFDAAAVLLAPDLVIEVPINEYPRASRSSPP